MVRFVPKNRNSNVGSYLAYSLIFTVGLSLANVDSASATEADDDWQARSTAPGVVRAIRFDTASEVTDFIHPDTGAANISFDTTNKASGSGSMRHLVPSNTHEATGSGSWRMNFSEFPYNVQFGENSEFFVQWRQKFDRFFMEHNYVGGGGWKQIIIGQGDVPNVEANACSELEIVVHNNKYWGMPQAYHSCGVYLPYHGYDGSDYLLQNAANCRWRNGNPDPLDGNCVPYVADEFMTFQIRVKLGTWQENVPDPMNSGNPANGFFPSEIELWVAREGEPSKVAIRFTDILLRRGTGNDDPSDASHTAEYGKIWLSTYNTGKSESETHQESSTWYDEVIISTTRIADPSVTLVRPDAPANVRAN